MKLKILFWILVIIVFGALSFIGFSYIETNVYKFLIIEGISVLAIILFFTLYHRSIKPYQIISNGIELLKEQDFSTRLRLTSNNEANKLIEIFNKMMFQLKEERLHVREKNHFLDLLIQASPQGVVILDFDDKITNINPAGARLLGVVDIADVTGKKLSEANVRLGSELELLAPDEDVIIRVSGITIYRCVRSSFIDRGFSHPFILIEELTNELLKIEKKSYENVIRMMAHEVNNSVGAIGSTLNIISDILHQNEDSELSDVLPAVDASFDRCGHLAHFISNFAEVVKIPEPSKSEVHLNELARSANALAAGESNRRNIRLILQLTAQNDLVNVDYIQIEQVLVNIIKNACEAIDSDGEIRIITRASPLSISIENDGPVISDELKQKLFIPFFTTKATGQGIGLMFVREILLNHECKFDLNSHEGWTKFEILF